jgi:hypothetical protein
MNQVMINAVDRCWSKRSRISRPRLELNNLADERGRNKVLAVNWLQEMKGSQAFKIAELNKLLADERGRNKVPVEREWVGLDERDTRLGFSYR